MFGLVGTDRVSRALRGFGRFLAGSFVLKVCWLTGVGFSHSPCDLTNCSLCDINFSWSFLYFFVLQRASITFLCVMLIFRCRIFPCSDDCSPTTFSLFDVNFVAILALFRALGTSGLKISSTSGP